MKMLLWLLAVAPACVIVDHAQQKPQPDTPIMHDCDRGYTAQILRPANGSTQTPQLTAQYIWDQTDVPDRYVAMSDLHGNFFTDNGNEMVQGDGSIVASYALPAGGTFVLEVGWICDAANDGPTVALAHVQFQTSTP